MGHIINTEFKLRSNGEYWWACGKDKRECKLTGSQHNRRFQGVLVVKLRVLLELRQLPDTPYI
ncbi:hypothetical protein HanRHA438_Chr12g0549841 [Helianthus annuus]|nr:hypothetical protein HanRHA438_Chr12g0549841 [Helianthus annuus]